MSGILSHSALPSISFQPAIPQFPEAYVQSGDENEETGSLAKPLILV
jgi:hypothetical protein